MIPLRRPRLLEAFVFASLSLLTGAAAAQEDIGDPFDAAFHLDDASLPDPARTPGDAVAKSTVDDLCAPGAEGRPVLPPQALCASRFAGFGISPAHRFQYRCVFLVPPDIGGAQTVKNVWLQPAAEVAFKDALDRVVRKRVCSREIPLGRAQRMVAGDWVVAYRALLLSRDRLLPPRKTDDAPPDNRLADPLPAVPGASFDAGAASSLGFDGGGGPERRRHRRLSDADGSRGGDEGRPNSLNDHLADPRASRADGRAGERRLPQDPGRDRNLAAARGGRPIGASSLGDSRSGVGNGRDGSEPRRDPRAAQPEGLRPAPGLTAPSPINPRDARGTGAPGSSGRMRGRRPAPQRSGGARGGRRRGR